MCHRRLARLGPLLAPLLLAGCPSPDTGAKPPQAGPATAVPPAEAPAKPGTPAAAAGTTGRPCEEIHRLVVTVQKGQPARFQVPLERRLWYVVYAGADDDGADPMLKVLDDQGKVLGENDDFRRNKDFSAVALQLEASRTVTVEASCFENNGGSIDVRVQKCGQLQPGDQVGGVVEDFNGFYFHAVTCREGTVYQATTSDLANQLDTLLSLHDPTDLWLLSECDDVAKDDLSSEVIWRCTRDGDYLLVVTGMGQESTGAYRLGLRELPVTGEAAPTAAR